MIGLFTKWCCARVISVLQDIKGDTAKTITFFS